MIMRLWLISGLLIVVVAWVLTVTLSPAPFQSSPASSAEGYRAKALLPKPGEFTLSEEIGHEVFEIPATDALHQIEEAAAGATHAMPGMTSMGGDVEPEHGDQAMPGMAEQTAEQTEQAMPGMTAGPQEGADHTGTGQMHAEGPAGQGGEAMPGMTMGGAEPEHGEPAMPGMAKEGEEGAGHPEAGQMQAEEAPGQGHGTMPGMAMGGAEPEHAEQSMPGMTEQPAEHAEDEAMAGMAMEAEQGHGPAQGHAGGAGLTVLPDQMAHMAQRTVELEMTEWGFRPASVTVKQGEVIRLVVRNAGNLPHEFMFMPMAGMAAVGYRLERADWNLLEHEALFERAVILPGDGFEAVFRIEQSGSWMYMCMFPYHMQFGMMGAMATEGAGTEGGMDMGGMKM